MADTETIPEVLKSYIFDQNNPNVNQQLRQRIALAMMTQKRSAPKNAGEGITAIGEALGENRLRNQLEASDLAAQKITPPPAAVAATPVVPAARYGEGDSSEDAAPPVVAAPPAPVARSVVTPPVIPPAPAARSVLPPAETAPAPFADRFNAARPGGGPQASLPSLANAPVLAEGNGPDAAEMGAGRNSLAQALMQQQAARGGPLPNPTSRAVTPPASAPTLAASSNPPAGGQGDPMNANALATPADLGIRAAPPVAQPIQQAPVRMAQAQPQAIPGYVPPQAGQPRGVPIIGMTPREVELRNWLAQNQGNPYAPAKVAGELGALTTAREIRQNEANEWYKSQLKQVEKQNELNLTGLGTQHERLQESARRATDLKYQEGKLIEEGLKRQQGLIGRGGEQGADPYIGTPRSRQRSGVPEADPMPAGVIPEDWAKDQQKKISADATALESAKPELRETLDLMGKIRAHPSKEASLGTLGGLARLTAGGQGFSALHDQLIGKNLVAAYQKIKGTGPVGEREGENIAKAQTALKTATTKEDYDTALDTLETTLRGATERAERKMRQPVTAYQRTPNDPYAPDLGQIDDTWKDGKVRQYIGGDPHDKDKSWKIVR